MPNVVARLLTWSINWAHITPIYILYWFPVDFINRFNILTYRALKGQAPDFFFFSISGTKSLEQKLCYADSVEKPVKTL